MSEKKEHLFPMERAGWLDIGIRRWLQNPAKIIKPHIKDGMTALDVGCGTGYFTLEMARMVGKSGRVIAADLQDGMLQIVSTKIKGTELEDRIVLHKCGENKIGVTGPVDFVLLFYMVHEVLNADDLFKEIESILKPNGQVLFVEPSDHVSKSAFEESLRKAIDAGLVQAGRQNVFFSRSVVLKKG